MRFIAQAALIAACVVLLCAGTATASSNPIVQLQEAKRQQEKLLVPGPAGWSMVRNVQLYQWLERRAAGAWRTITWNPYWAIRYVFGTRWAAAWNVALCEAGRPMPSPNAHNGQYVNIFQMGLSERRLYGWHVQGSAPLLAARAAFRYSSGGRSWGPWSCKP